MLLSPGRGDRHEQWSDVKLGAFLELSVITTFHTDNLKRLLILKNKIYTLNAFFHTSG